MEGIGNQRCSINRSIGFIYLQDFQDELLFGMAREVGGSLTRRSSNVRAIKLGLSWSLARLRPSAAKSLDASTTY